MGWFGGTAAWRDGGRYSLRSPVRCTAGVGGQRGHRRCVCGAVCAYLRLTVAGDWCLCSKPRGIRCARKLRLTRKANRWADLKYKKRNLGTWLKANPFAGSSHAKGIVLEKMCVPHPHPRVPPSSLSNGRAPAKERLPVCGRLVPQTPSPGGCSTLRKESSAAAPRGWPVTSTVSGLGWAAARPCCARRGYGDSLVVEAA